MGTEIKTWQIVNNKLTPVNTSLKNEGRTEPYDLEPWIASHPLIIGPDIAIIGKQVMSKSGPIDLLGIDRTGNLVIIEIKRDKLPREALAQAIDYASDAAEWTIDKIAEICLSYTTKGLVEFISESFPDIDVEAININDSQRIVLIGFSVESSLERMIEWLSDNFNVNINAVVLNYIKTLNGDELLARTSIISEEIELERVKKKKKFEIPMSDEPGSYDKDNLKELLTEYLSKDQVTSLRIRDVLLPVLLKKKTVTREQLKKEFLDFDKTVEASKVGYHLTTISTQLGMKKNDFLRQIISYEYPTYSWEKDNFSIRPDYHDFINSILEELKQKENANKKMHPIA